MGEVEWSDWIEHDGIGFPVLGIWAQVEYADGEVVERFFDGQTFWEDSDVAPSNYQGVVTKTSWDWSEAGNSIPAVRYRIRKPRALREMVTLAADPYAPPPVIHPEGPVRQPERVPA